MAYEISTPTNIGLSQLKRGETSFIFHNLFTDPNNSSFSFTNFFIALTVIKIFYLGKIVLAHFSGKIVTLFSVERQLVA